MPQIFFIFVLIMSSISIASTHFEAWKGFSDPEIMDSGFTHELAKLPLKGTIDINPRGWSGDYWASKKGSINYRWNSQKPEGFKLKSPSFAEARSMSSEQLSSLAPSEKYDLLIGNYEYPLRKEVEDVASKLSADWAGICHGWAPASLHHHEPTAKVLKNPDGLLIPFGSSDIKALLSYYYAFHAEDETSHQVGLRCFFGRWLGGARGCDEDLNAGAFHIVMTNMLGLKGEGFVADIDRFREVWNQPIVAYESEIISSRLAPSEFAAKTAAYELRVRTELFYVDESNENTWNSAFGTDNQKISSRLLQYRIEVNRENKIVGGSWESDERPDFLWNRSKATQFRGLFSRLPELLND